MLRPGTTPQTASLNAPTRVFHLISCPLAMPALAAGPSRLQLARTCAAATHLAAIGPQIPDNNHLEAVRLTALNGDLRCCQNPPSQTSDDQPARQLPGEHPTPTPRRQLRQHRPPPSPGPNGHARDQDAGSPAQPPASVSPLYPEPPIPATRFSPRRHRPPAPAFKQTKLAAHGPDATSASPQGPPQQRPAKTHPLLDSKASAPRS